MPFAKCKVYSDGGHYIAIPHTTRPYRPRRKPNEEVITITEEIQSEPPAEDTSAFSEDESAPVSPAEAGCGEVCDKAEKPPQKADEPVKVERQTTRRELFDELYLKYQSLPRYKRKAAILKRMRPYFQDEYGARLYVDTQMSRKIRNLIARRVRMVRKVNLQEFNYFVTFTYSNELHTEESFKKGLQTCLRNFCYRKGWKYIGVWERSPQKQRLHFHGLFYIPDGTMPNMQIDVIDYNFKAHRRQVSHQITYFNDRFGRSDFRPIEDRQMLGGSIAYIVKYLEKTGEKIVYSRGLPQYFLSDIMDEDVVCPFGLEDKKLLLFDDFLCWDEGCLIGTVSKETIALMPKSN